MLILDIQWFIYLKSAIPTRDAHVKSLSKCAATLSFLRKIRGATNANGRPRRLSPGCQAKPIENTAKPYGPGETEPRALTVMSVSGS